MDFFSTHVDLIEIKGSSNIVDYLAHGNRANQKTAIKRLLNAISTMNFDVSI